jgi:hypothetical protein
MSTEKTNQLTLDELRQMDGQPIWVKRLYREPDEWGVVGRSNGGEKDIFVICGGGNDCHAFNYNSWWLAYKQPLEVTK